MGADGRRVAGLLAAQGEEREGAEAEQGDGGGFGDRRRVAEDDVVDDDEVSAAAIGESAGEGGVATVDLDPADGLIVIERDPNEGKPTGG